MVPETKATTKGTAPVVWRSLTAGQQQALAGELARLLCQYVQGAAERAALTRAREVDDDGPTQDR
jgi:hypothetical protein